VLYTPAPDIVHEAAGHAPMLVHPEYNAYLRGYASVASKAIFSKEDLNQYEAIRQLSDIKEHPQSTREQILLAEQKLLDVNKTLSFVSEAGWLARLGWWTTEYGLIGSVRAPKIYGAGLLSSLGESRDCFRPQVRKIPLSIDCIETSYNITEPQPQLFVVEKLSGLQDVLHQLEERMAFRCGGTAGLATALKARTVNTVQLNSGLQISGQLAKVYESGDRTDYLQFQGPCQLAFANRELPGHGTSTHSSGFGTPVGLLKNQDQCLSEMSNEQLLACGLRNGHPCRLEFASGVTVHGTLVEALSREKTHLILSFEQCSVEYQSQILFDPSWGRFDMALGKSVVSVFGGSADREKYPISEEFAVSQVPQKTYSAGQLRRHAFYEKIRQLRSHKSHTTFAAQLCNYVTEYLSEWADQWLLGVELLELLTLTDLRKETDAILSHLHHDADAEPSDRQFCIDQGIRLAAHGL
jgi:phenylalanine-4-hydroxylase